MQNTCDYEHGLATKRLWRHIPFQYFHTPIPIFRTAILTFRLCGSVTCERYLTASLVMVEARAAAMKNCPSSKYPRSGGLERERGGANFKE